MFDTLLSIPELFGHQKLHLLVMIANSVDVFLKVSLDMIFFESILHLTYMDIIYSQLFPVCYNVLH
jgi:hypothetical protein